MVKYLLVLKLLYWPSIPVTECLRQLTCKEPRSALANGLGGISHGGWGDGPHSPLTFVLVTEG